MNMNLSSRFQNTMPTVTAFFIFLFLLADAATLSALPIVKSKGSGGSPQRFVRQKNTLSNMQFYFTNKGVLFNNDQTAGLNWPRGSANSYIYGGGIWFGTKKRIGGKLRKLVELGYNPNSGAGWFAEGEVGMNIADRDSKYGSYVSGRYDGNYGNYNGDPNITSLTKPFVPWPIWDTSASKTINQNYYFGDYISDVAARTRTDLSTGKTTKPAMLSQEDIVNIYTDEDVSNNPEFRPNTGYPFGLNVVEVIYSWSFGRYRDMIFVRHHITNASKDVLYECFMAPAFDPDLGVGSAGAQGDHNQYFGSDTADIIRGKRVLKGTCYENDVRRLNLALQQSNSEGGKGYGVIGFTFLESPAVNSKFEALDNSDSVAVRGYGLPNSVPQLGLTTFKKWQLANDPPTPDLRYDFVSDGSKDGDGGIIQDMRLLFATGPFTLLPGKSVETVVGIAIAQVNTLVDNTNNKNIDSLLKLIAFAHEVFGGDCYTKIIDSNTSIIKHFITPVPPDIPNLKTTGLDRAVYLTWDSTADNSKDPLSSTLAFNQYDLYRTTRSDLDSTIRPDGINPTVKLGSWTIYDFKQDSVFDGAKKFTGFKLTRTNTVPKKIPHSFLDLGDDNKDGILSGSEGLFNGVKYYYFLTATDEFDSANKVGPLTTAIVAPKNLVVGIPAKPVFPDIATLITNNNCFAGADLTKKPQVNGIRDVGISITDTGKFVELFANDTVLVSFQPRWNEYVQNALEQSPLDIFVDVSDQRQGVEYTYEILNNPKNTPTTVPYSFNSGLRQSIIGQNPDSNVAGKFTTDNSKFAPLQRIYQAFSVQADFEFTQLTDPYHLNSIKPDPSHQNIGDFGMIHLSQRTLPERNKLGPIDLRNIPAAATNPSFLGSLGEVDYEITFGDPVDMNEVEFDSTTHTTFTINSLKDANANVEYHPRPLPITIKSITHCNQQLRVIRPGNRDDITVEQDYRYYSKNTNPPNQPGLFFPAFSDPDTLVTPNPGWFAVDAYHFSDLDKDNHQGASFFLKTTGNYYYPGGTQDGVNYLETVHRIRLGGAEIILNRPSIGQYGITGDTISQDGNQLPNDFQPGDKLIVSFGGHVRGLPFPGAVFKVPTSPNGRVDFAGAGLYENQSILDQVQVVPNPYVVTHIGQSSTDAAKLFFTRLPPRATIEIYTLSGDLVKTLEHYGYVDKSATKDQPRYDYSSLADRYNVEEWNLLTEGRQRVGSQVLIARVIAKDPNSGDKVLGETIVKFAVVLGGYRQVR